MSEPRIYDDLLSKKAKLAVIGLGYVGLPIALEFARRISVIGFDINARRIALMRKGIEAAKAAGYGAIILVGDEPYYARVGFAKLPPGRISFPGPVDRARVLGLSLKPDALANLSGDVRRAEIDDPVCADGAPLGG